MCPIHLHCIFFIEFSIGLAYFQSVLLDTLSDHFRCRILRRYWLINACITFLVSSAYFAAIFPIHEVTLL